MWFCRALRLLLSHSHKCLTDLTVATTGHAVLVSHVALINESATLAATNQLQVVLLARPCALMLCSNLRAGDSKHRAAMMVAIAARATIIVNTAVLG